MKLLLSCILVLGLVPTQAQARDQASMTELMRQLTPFYVNTIKANKSDVKLEEHLLKLLLTTFEADWSKAKECLLFGLWPQSVKMNAPSHEAGLKLMAELVRMRTVICNDVATKTQVGIKDQLQKQLQKQEFLNDNPLSQAGLLSDFLKEIRQNVSAEAHFKPLTSTGAEKLTSDIDVASNGLNTEMGVRFFNENFRKDLKVAWDPATVFDYNIYAADWIFPANFIEEKTAKGTRLTPRPEHVLARDARDQTATDSELQTEDIKLQDERTVIFEKAALLHLRRNCTEADWLLYVRQRWGEGAKTLALLQSVDLQFKSFNAEVAAMIKKLAPDAPKPQGSLWPDSYYEEALETRARNQIYTTRLLRVKALRLDYKLLREKSEKLKSDRQQMSLLAKQLTEALTEAIFFANEVYATEGATLHATQALQKVAKEKAKGNTLEVVLTTPQYEQAFHENVGDALHSLNHYKDTPAYAAYRAGKYIERMLLAGEFLARDTPRLVTKHSDYPTLQALATQAAEVKASPAGDDPKEIEKVFHKSYKTEADMKRLRDAILRFGAELPGKLRKK